jgi:hypothetical protein
LIRIRYISRRFDETAVLSTLAKLAFSSDPSLEEEDYAVLAALRRSSEDWQLSIAETSERLSSYDDEQIAGLTSNVKGILHEMEFQALENEDGDSVVAALFPDTNHRAVDIQMLDQNTGLTWEVQLKATDDLSAINSWMDSNPDTEILVTEELSERMGLESSSGFSNEDLTLRVEEFVDQMIELDDDAEDSLWTYFPALVAASAGIIIFELWRRYRAGLISLDEFKTMTARTVGIKTAKYAGLFSALAVPGLNIIVGAYLLGSLIFAVSKYANKPRPFKPFSFLASRL